MARTPREVAADLFAVLFCLLRLTALWVVFLLVLPLSTGVNPMFLSKLKKLHRSKTVILNAIAAIAGVAQAVSPYLDPETAAKAAAGVAVLNVFIRVFGTKVPVEQK